MAQHNFDGQSGPTQTLTYDALGRLHSTKLSTASTPDTYRYVGSSQTSWDISLGAGGRTDSLVGADGSRLATTSFNSSGTKVALSWLVPDLHGSSVATLSEDELTFQTAYRFDGCGLTVGTPFGGGQPYRYQGQIDVSPDASKPLYVDGARFESPGIGAFTSRDSVAGQVQDPLSLNRFLYAEANPTTLVDPTGHAGCSYGKKCSTGGSVIVPGNDGTTTVINNKGVHKQTNQIPTCSGKCGDDQTIPAPTTPTVSKPCSTLDCAINSWVSGTGLAGLGAAGITVVTTQIDPATGLYTRTLTDEQLAKIIQVVEDHGGTLWLSLKDPTAIAAARADAAQLGGIAWPDFEKAVNEALGVTLPDDGAAALAAIESSTVRIGFDMTKLDVGRAVNSVNSGLGNELRLAGSLVQNDPSLGSQFLFQLGPDVAVETSPVAVIGWGEAFAVRPEVAGDFDEFEDFGGVFGGDYGGGGRHK